MQTLFHFPYSLVIRQAQDAPSKAPGQPLEAVSDVADTTSEAAISFLQWISSGQREALIALAVAIGSAALFYGARMGLMMILPKLPRRDQYSLSAIVRRMVGRIRSYFILAASLLIAGQFIEFPSAVDAGIQIVFVLASVLQVAELLQELVVSFIKRGALRNSGDAVALASAVNVLKWLANVSIWSVALLLILDNIGADVTALLAGLGIGGVAIGLAAQGIFKDLFSALSIIFDRPFQRGDVIKYGETWGTIEDIGLKTTRIRSKTGEQIIISNTNLLDLEIHNLARMPKRRIETGFGIIYGTHPDQAEKVVGLVSKLVEEIDGVDLECCNFAGFGASSLDFELVFYSLNPDYKRSKAATSKLLLAVFRKFHEEGINFAFPTQTIHLASLPGDTTEEIAGAVERSLKSIDIGDAA
ncbi:MAG: mechanosensitive ion channel domain-containing protein [Pseudomonadota bacterium]